MVGRAAHNPLVLALGAVAAVIAVAILGGVASPGRDGGRPGSVVTPSPAAPAPTPAQTSPAFVPAQTVVPVSGAATPAGGPGMVVGVVGDSVMVSAMPGLQAEAAKRGWTLINGAHRACPVGYEPLFMLDGSPTPGQCQTIESLHDQLIATRPDAVIWLDINSRWARKDPAGRLLAPGSQPWKDDLFPEWTRVLDRFLAAGARVVVVLPPLRSQQAEGCEGVASEGRCREIQSQDATIREATLEWFASLDGREGAYLVEVDSILCPDGNPCPGRISGIQVRPSGYDQTHFTTAGATWFAPRLFDIALAAMNGTPGATISD